MALWKEPAGRLKESHFCARDFRGGELYTSALIAGFLQTRSTCRSFFSIRLFSAKGLSLALISSSSEIFPASIFPQACSRATTGAAHGGSGHFSFFALAVFD